MPDNILIELHFLPSQEYFSTLRKASVVYLEKYENCPRQSYRNRCYILTSQGPDRFTVPLQNLRNHTPIKDVRIDHSVHWQETLLRTLRSAYAHAPYYEHYIDELMQVLHRRHLFLYDLNFEILTLCLGWLKWSVTLTETKEYIKHPDPSVTDMRNVILAKQPWNERNLYIPKPYQQVFSQSFVPNLSILDVIFCEGPHAHFVLN